MKLDKRGVLRVTPQLLGNLFFEDGERHFVISRGVPSNARFLYARYNDLARCFELMYESEEFDVVEEGQECPILDPPIIKKIKKEK